MASVCTRLNSLFSHSPTLVADTEKTSVTLSRRLKKNVGRWSTSNCKRHSVTANAVNSHQSSSVTRVIAGSPDEDCQPAAVDSGRQGRSGEQGVQDGACCVRQRQALSISICYTQNLRSSASPSSLLAHCESFPSHLDWLFYLI